LFKTQCKTYPVLIDGINAHGVQDVHIHLGAPLMLGLLLGAEVVRRVDIAQLPPPVHLLDVGVALGLFPQLLGGAHPRIGAGRVPQPPVVAEARHDAGEGIDLRVGPVGAQDVADGRDGGPERPPRAVVVYAKEGLARRGYIPD